LRWTVARYLRRIRHRGDPGKRWLAFVQNHWEIIVAFDFFTVGTLTFQLREAFPEAGPYRYVILDRDSKFDATVITFLKSTGLKPKRTSNRPDKTEPRNAGLEVVDERSWTMSSHWTDTFAPADA
jgi:hypothetical protein